MSKPIIEDHSSQGLGDQKGEIPSTEQIRSWMERDLGSCITFLNALYNDAALKDQMAIFLQGRISNSRHKPDPNQLPVFENGHKGK